MAFTFLSAEWRKLVMAQYEVAPEVLRGHLPRGLELDLYRAGPGGEARCFVSLVGFLFDRVRVVGAAFPGHTRFEEVNLRYYVRRRMADGSYRRGVVFLSEIVPRPAITLLARGLYGEAYSTAAMSHLWRHPEGDRGRVEISYEWRHRGLWQSLAVRARNELRPMDAGSMEEFITEHYWGYTRRRDGGTAEYAVEHARWQTYPVEEYRIVCDFGALYGPAWAELAGRQPDHVLLAEGAPVKVRWGGRVA